MDDLVAAILDVREKLSRGVFSNEDQVSKGVVMRLLQQLGWDVYDPAQVSSEFRIGNRKADYALRHGPFGSAVLIEVKDVGKATPKGEDQLFDYCFKEGVPLAVLTDGRVWNFYWPAGRGNYEQRRFAVADLVDDEAPDCARMLNRYLAFHAVTSGQFEEDARSDYAAYQQQIVAKEQFLGVFESLVAGADPRVVSLFRDEVENRCGIRPDEGDVRTFLLTRSTQPEVLEPSRRWPRGSSQPSQKARQTRAGDASAKPSVQQDAPLQSSSFTLFGRTVSCRNDKEVLIGVVKELGERDPGLYARLAPHFVGKRRNFLVQDRSQIYPAGSTESVLRSVEKLPGGWWLGTHSSTRLKNEQLKKVREITGLPSSQFSWQMKGKTDG